MSWPAVLFMLLLAPRHGLINRLIGAVTPLGTEHNWLGNPELVMPALVIASLWLSIGYGMIYFLAALQAVDQELYEAAEVEGANAVQKWMRITVPLLKPTTLYLMVIYTIAGFQVFERVYIMTGGGPINRTTTIVQLIYMTAFSDFNFGRASAQALVLFAVIAVFSFVQFRFLSTDVEY